MTRFSRLQPTTGRPDRAAEAGASGFVFDPPTWTRAAFDSGTILTGQYMLEAVVRRCGMSIVGGRPSGTVGPLWR